MAESLVHVELISEYPLLERIRDGFLGRGHGVCWRSWHALSPLLEGGVGWVPAGLVIEPESCREGYFICQARGRGGAYLERQSVTKHRDLGELWQMEDAHPVEPWHPSSSAGQKGC